MKINPKNNPNIEYISRDEIRGIQSGRLIDTVSYVYRNSAFYRRYYIENGISPEDIKSLDDLNKLPFITRDHLANLSDEMVCVPRSEWIDICPTSGTTGQSIYFPMTKNDLILFARICARGAYSLGIDRNDTVQVMLTSDNLLQPTKIMTYMFQFEIGSLALRVGPVGTERQVKLMRDLKPDVLFGISTYLQSLGRSLDKYEFDPKKELDLKLLISTGSTIYHSRWSPTALHREVSEIWGAPYYSILGSTELNTGFWECPARNGHHVHQDYFIAEIIDPDTGKTLSPGERGELVMTAMGREAMPLVRYRTGDITSLEIDECPCGRKNPRIMAIVGRRDQMLKIKGTLAFPLQVEEAVLSVQGIKAHFIEVVNDENGQAQLNITIAPDPDLENAPEEVTERVKSRTLITPRVSLDTRESIESVWYSEKRVKPRKFRDKRKKVS
ncbi:MAG: hypothetical protein K8T10_06685 [Candidatus Eremiobacteraeota bacterium]|nr:hypothetical protein [Candidatus Eremiobacteraeota bacterium]